VDRGRLEGRHPDHPAWYLNLAENPDIEIQVKDEVIPVTASTVEGEERDRLWSLMTEVWPDYDAYQSNTDRKIPIVALERR